MVFGHRPMSSRQRAAVGALLGVALAALVWRAARGDLLGAVLSLLLHGGVWTVVALSTLVQLVLEEHDLVLRRPLRTRRIPYRDLADVRGSVPGRPTWGTDVRLHLRDGTTVPLPDLDVTPRQLRDAILPRLSGPSDPPASAPA